MRKNDPHIGAPRDRVDGPAKVTGQATYVAEFPIHDLAHGYVVASAIARGRVVSIDTKAAETVAGVIKIFTHQNRPPAAWFSYEYQDQVGPPGKPFRPLYSNEILFDGQPVALVVADTFEAARHAASLIRVEYDRQPHRTDFELARADSYTPPKQRNGISPPPKPRGNVEKALSNADFRVTADYKIAAEYHNPMELHASTVVWEGNGKITVHDKTQGVQNTQSYIASVFSLSPADVRVQAPFVGGGFGSGLRPQHQLFLAVMAALALERSVRVELTREQMFGHVHRPETVNTVSLGADADGKLTAIRHSAIAATSRYEDHQEVVVNWSGLLYQVDNADFDYELTKLDISSPGDMRAPGAPLGMFALESAMDELAFETGLDPVELRLRNYTERDENEGKQITSKELKACYREGAERFGWSRRNPRPGSMRDGNEVIGWGMAGGVWEANMQKTAARVTLRIDGKLEVSCATSDIGTGTYTILSQIAAEELGLDMEAVTVRLADSTLPKSPVQGGSWTAASAGSAVTAACKTLREKLVKQAARMNGSPLSGAGVEDVIFESGRIARRADPSQAVTLPEAVAAGRVDLVEAEEVASPGIISQLRYSSYTHSAVFVEVRIDEELGVVRVSRVVSAVAAGRILNPKTARSQIVGGVVWGVGMALHEEAMTDHALGRIMNHNLAEYHVPVNADIEDIDVIFVAEEDSKTSPIGVKGLGEIGIVGTAAAIANAIFHATGKRIRSLPITIDKVLETPQHERVHASATVDHRQPASVD